MKKAKKLQVEVVKIYMLVNFANTEDKVINLYLQKKVNKLLRVFELFLCDGRYNTVTRGQVSDIAGYKLFCALNSKGSVRIVRFAP